MRKTDIKAAFDAMCQLAAVETMRYFRHLPDIENKLEKGFDPVTAADKAAEKAIRNWIGEHYPEHGIFGEEFGQCNEDSEYRWIIDPIDGTRAYICGLPSWATLIGLYQNNVPIAGIMAQPFTGEKYWTVGDSSWLERDSKKTQLQTSKIEQLEQATIMSTAPELFTGDEAALWDKISSSCQLKRYGFDSYAYAMLAAGHIELVVESGLKAYDIAALIPLIENAGGVVSNWQGGSASQGGQILACANAQIHRQALDQALI